MKYIPNTLKLFRNLTKYVSGAFDITPRPWIRLLGERMLNIKSNQSEFTSSRKITIEEIFSY